MAKIDVLKKQIIEVCKLMHTKGFICATDGNVSVKIAKDRFLITPSGINKAFLKASDLIVIDRNAKVITGNKKFKPSSEWRMHLKAYDLRPDIDAVIHSHPPYITAYTIADVEIPSKILPEMVLTMGAVPVTEYSVPTSPDNAKIIEKHIVNFDAVVLKRHGVITVGKGLYSAYNKLEKLEHAAITGLAAHALGGCNALGCSELKELLNMGQDMGFLSNSCVTVCKKDIS